MARGLLSGIGLGAVFSVGVAGVVSVLVPMQPQPAPQMGTAESVSPPQPAVLQPTVIVTGEGSAPVVQPQVSLRTPEGGELPKEPAVAALAPQTTTDVTGTLNNGPLTAEPVVAPQNEVMATASVPTVLPPVDGGAEERTPVLPTVLPQPQTGVVADLTQPRPLPQGVIARAGEDAAVLPNPQALAPMIPDDSQDAAIAMPEAEASQEAVAGVARESDVAPEGEVVSESEETFIVVEPAPEAEAEAETQEQASVAQTAPKPRVLTVPGRPVGTLGSTGGQSVGTPANTLINRSPQLEATPVETVSQTPDTRPISTFAQPFENPEGKPLMSIVLMDTGADLDADAIGLPALSSFPYPVSFAVDVNLFDAAERAERYRAEGFDVLAMVNLPQGARPTDAEVSLSVALNGMPEIVGVIEGTGAGLQGSREVADQVTRILLASGHGLVAQSKGLNSMPKLALKEGVPAAPVFRDFDSEGQQPRVIRRFLDQAAFKAGQEGGVIMLGRLRPETIEALLVWGLADRAGSVALAPVSAVLLAQ
ncbi:polysaccharide deacteylase family 2 protein [uncultured Sulfitobacter sp.]|uniref:divergent polysaccharide deacetylase family protein n=1 Tax=uncultured Sulfitobacter sp. TaxID=191468 RepID=UPI00261F605D|nr:polysaccharide deacteylase family 2 protein [uncultured Sulfitobacter sp.]